ncbi:MAG: DinB family protein [Caldilinea sp. CFX5]|nr:DinB family protein [Caldilinea sp. CFX5]
MSNQSAINLLREQYKQSHQWLQGTLQGVDAQVAHFQPGGVVSPIAGHAAHAVTGLDFLLLSTIAGKQPLLVSSFAGKAGVSKPSQDGDWLGTERGVVMNVAEFAAYQDAVFAALDDWLAGLQDTELAREVEMPFGTFTVVWWLNTMLLNTFSHTGEIAAIKGLQGLKGYPM